MSIIPDPAELVKLARSTQRKIVDREWKQYQRYLNKFERYHKDCSEETPLTFEEFCTRLGNQGGSNQQLGSQT
jgi:hypothetical protein